MPGFLNLEVYTFFLAYGRNIPATERLVASAMRSKAELDPIRVDPRPFSECKAVADNCGYAPAATRELKIRHLCNSHRLRIRTKVRKVFDVNEGQIADWNFVLGWLGGTPDVSYPYLCLQGLVEPSLTTCSRFFSTCLSKRIRDHAAACWEQSTTCHDFTHTQD